MKTWLLLSCLTREYNFHRLSHRAEFPSVPQATFSRLLQPRIHVFGPHISTSMESGFTGHHLPCWHPTSKHPEQYPAGRMVSICSLTRGCVLEVHSEQGGGHLGILLGKEALGQERLSEPVPSSPALPAVRERALLQEQGLVQTQTSEGRERGWVLSPRWPLGARECLLVICPPSSAGAGLPLGPRSLGPVMGTPGPQPQHNWGACGKADSWGPGRTGCDSACTLQSERRWSPAPTAHTSPWAPTVAPRNHDGEGSV